MSSNLFFGDPVTVRTRLWAPRGMNGETELGRKEAASPGLSWNLKLGLPGCRDSTEEPSDPGFLPPRMSPLQGKGRSLHSGTPGTLSR